MTTRRNSLLKPGNDKLFVWSWNAPVPEGIDAAQHKLETNHQEVKDWLDREHLSQYAPLFQSNNISGAEVPFLKDEHLKQIGVEKVGHRIKLLIACKQFKRTLQNWERNETIIECRN